ncbi:MAG: heavy metal-binding domain-containing protein [Calditrichaceae bacterium]|jgi:uncharacterized protein with PIN domain
MRILFFTLVSMSFFILGCSQDKQDQSQIQPKHQMNMSGESMQHGDHAMQMDPTSAESIVYYTCPMEDHKHIHSAEQGKCPECNMALVPVVKTTKEKAEYYGCPMEEHSHIRSDKPGDCPECGMFLQPMRLDKNTSMEM